MMKTSLLRYRRLCPEQLEERTMLAGDTGMAVPNTAALLAATGHSQLAAAETSAQVSGLLQRR